MGQFLEIGTNPQWLPGQFLRFITMVLKIIELVLIYNQSSQAFEKKPNNLQ
jgi:hypothetical protein